MDNMRLHAERFNTEIIFDLVHTCDFCRRDLSSSGAMPAYTAVMR